MRGRAWWALGLTAVLCAPAQAQRFSDRKKNTPDAGETGTDWFAEVDRACTARRYGLQLAASRKVAEAGDEAVPAIRSWAEQNGANELPAIFVNAIADATTAGDATLGLLREWAGDVEFYWRAQALRGLAERRRADDHARFASGLDDPSHLYRIFAAKGLLQLGDADDRSLVRVRLLRDPDPRVPPAVAGMLLDLGAPADIQILIDALGWTHKFLGDPWGQRTAQEAFKAIARWLDSEVTWPRGGADERDAAIASIVGEIRAKGIEVELPHQVEDLGVAAVGGIEIRSCRHGDFFVRWDADGRWTVGLLGEEGPDLGSGDAPNWGELRQFLARDEGVATYGVVICDFVRIVDTTTGLSLKAAPDALPTDVTSGLKRIIEVLDEKGPRPLAEALQVRLRQFAAQSK